MLAMFRWQLHWWWFVGKKLTKAPSPGISAVIGFVADAKLVQFEIAEASALHNLTFAF